MGLALFGEARVFGGGTFDALGERFDFRFAADRDFAQLREPRFHRFLQLFGGLFRAAFDR